MNRHEQLKPLSRQHHNGLLAALLLKKGLSKNADAGLMKDFIVNFWNNDLREHFENEEKHLLPALSGTGFQKELTERLLNEHRILADYVTSIKQGRGGDVIESFYTLLEQHIRFEERVYFPAAEAVLTDDQLRKIGAQLTDEGENCMNYPVKFWE